MRTLALVFLAFALAKGEDGRCGLTHLLAPRPSLPPPPARTGKRAPPPPSRVLLSDHFAIRYCLAGLDQVRLGEEDASLILLRDSLYAAVGGSPGEAAADAAVLSRLDGIGAPHPRYAEAAAARLEEARKAFVEGLGMRPPRASLPSPYYRAAPRVDGRYPVDIADIDRVVPEWAGLPTYAYSFDWDGRSGIALENDFLYRAAMGPDGRPRGTPITSAVDGAVKRDYSVEWQAGLAVTCPHELYHAVQVAHVPGRPDPFHVWYEASATAMEERLAPEVDDWHQYLDDMFSRMGSLSLAEYPSSLDNAQYGAAAFHHFLAEELGAGFDRAFWERLGANGNAFADALERALSRGGLTPMTSHTRYAARLAYSGSSVPGPWPPLAGDQSRWPSPWDAPMDASEAAPDLGVLPPLSIKPLVLSGLRAAPRALFLRDTALRAVILRPRGDSLLPEFPDSDIVPLIPEPGGPDILRILVVNGSLGRSGRAGLAPFSTRADTVVYAYPNPVPRTSGTVFFSRIPGGAEVSLYAEDGRPLRTLDFGAGAPAWAWDMEDGNGKGRKVRPGILYYRAKDGPLRPLYIVK
jgi:hypothetical protein